MPKTAAQLRQPQDGAIDLRIRPTLINAHARNPLREPEDAGITGGTRSLNRRVLGLNGVARFAPVAPTEVIPQLLDAAHSPRNTRSADSARPNSKRVQVA